MDINATTFTSGKPPSASSPPSIREMLELVKAYTAPRPPEIIESKYCADYVPERVRRTWGERLFSIPWKPWRTHKVITKEIPWNSCYVLEGKTVVAHPVTAAKIRTAWAVAYGIAPSRRDDEGA